MASKFVSVDEVKSKLLKKGYVADDGLSVSIYLSLARNRPLMLEGEAGVGKTEIAKVISEILDRDLIRLQCYEGLDISSSAYEWNYAQQLIEIQSRVAEENRASDFFTEEFLIERPLLKAIRTSQKGAPVLLIDEIDRADESFEAYLLELLSDWQITIPEIGTIKAQAPPIVILTSNRTREIRDALKRRCFYHWIDYPTKEVELQILTRKVPLASEKLQKQIVSFVQSLRGRDLFKSPGVAETIDWAHALVELNCVAIDPQTLDNTLGVLLKYQDDIAHIRGSEAGLILSEIMSEINLSEYKRK